MPGSSAAALDFEAVTGDLFAPAWARVDRADELRRQMAKVWNAYTESDPYHVSLDGQGDGVYILRLVQDEPMPSELAIAIGEWLYNLRSALDYLMWATAAHVSGQIPPPGEGQLQYPIYDSEAAWTNNLYRLKRLGEHHREMLKTMQPFNSNPDANYLGWINRLARVDRHRHLSDMTAYIAEMEPVIAIPDGCSATLQWGECLVSRGFADVARIVVTPWNPGMEVNVNPRLGIEPEIADWADSPFWKRVRFSERFHMLQIFGAAEVAVYEYDCTGRSRRADALTDDYKAECDARLSDGPSQPVRATRAPVNWTASEDGAPSTSQCFDGAGFPAERPYDVN